MELIIDSETLSYEHRVALAVTWMIVLMDNEGDILGALFDAGMLMHRYGTHTMACDVYRERYNITTTRPLHNPIDFHKE